MALTRRKKIVFALITISISFAGMVLLLLAADLILHQRAERSAGLNRYGYRGSVAGKKQPGELRAVMLGGSTVFGYGVAWNESIPAYLETRLQERLGRPVRVINLGFNNEGAYAFVPNLEDFAYLDYDAVVLYEGYNDLPGDEKVNTAVYRRDSAVYRLTGYFPILPLYLDEKAKLIRFGGDLNAAYRANDPRLPPTVFRPNLAQRTSADALDAAASISKALENQLGRLSQAPPAELSKTSAIGCSRPWVNYCDSIHAAVTRELSRGKLVAVVAQPRMRNEVQDKHRSQQETLAAMMMHEFGANPRVAFVDLSTAIDLSRKDVTFDPMHLNGVGNQIVADALSEPLQQFLKQ